MKEKKHMLLEIILSLFIFFCLFGFNNDHFNSSTTNTSIVIPYINVNFSVLLFLLSIFSFCIILNKKKLNFNNISLLLFLRIFFYFIPLLYFKEDSNFQIGIAYSIIQCFFSFFIGFNAKKIKYKNIVNILFTYTIFIFFEEIATLLLHNISIFSSNLKWFMVIPVGRNNYISCILLPTFILVSKYYSNNKIFKFIYSFIIFIAILATGSRLALILFLLYIIYDLLFVNNKFLITKNKLSILFIIIIFLSGIILFSKHSFNLSEMFNRIFSSSLYKNRFMVYKDSIKLFFKNPLLGRSAFSYNVFDVRKCHNFFLESLVQTGIIGTVIYTMAIFLSIKNINQIQELKIRESLKGFVIMWLIQGLMEPNLFGLVSDFYFWIIVGLANSVFVEERRYLR